MLKDLAGSYQMKSTPIWLHFNDQKHNVHKDVFMKSVHTLITFKLLLLWSVLLTSMALEIETYCRNQPDKAKGVL